MRMISQITWCRFANLRKSSSFEVACEGQVLKPSKRGRGRLASPLESLKSHFMRTLQHIFVLRKLSLDGYTTLPGMRSIEDGGRKILRKKYAWHNTFHPSQLLRHLSQIRSPADKLYLFQYQSISNYLSAYRTLRKINKVLQET
jgi:hypothetical protein